MGETQPTGSELVLYILLPTIGFVVIVIIVCYCYKKRVCHYYKNDEALLANNEEKSRVTIDLGRRSNSVLSDLDEHTRQMGVKRRRSDNEGKLHSGQYASYDVDEFERSRQRSLEKRQSSGILIPSLCIPTHKPNIKHSVAVGQALDNNLLVPTLVGPDNSVHLKRRSLGSILENSTFDQLQIDSERNDEKLYLRSTGNLTYNSKGDTKAPPLSHSLSEPAGSPKLILKLSPLHDPGKERRISQQQDKEFESSESLNTEDNMDTITALYFNRKASPRLPRDSRVLDLSEKKDSDDEAPANNNNNLQVNDGRLTPIENESPLTPVHTGRRRSSMQLPIDFRQIDPNMYRNITRMASAESDDTSDGEPLIHFSLTYDMEIEVLTVKLIQARCLPTLNPPYLSDPYCTVALIPDSTRRKSKVHKKTSDPEFEETFTFNAAFSELKDKLIEIRSFEYDQFSRDECTGVMKMKMSELDFQLMPKYDLWKKFKPVLQHRASQDAETYGDILLALSYLPSAEKLTVVIQKARGLKFNSNKKHSQDSHVKVYLCKDEQRVKKKATSTVRGFRNPVFNQALNFTVPQNLMQSEDVHLVLQVVEDGKIQSKENLGFLDIGPHCENENDRQHWNEITKKHINKPVARWHKLKKPRRSSGIENSPLEFLSRGRRESNAGKEFK